MKNKILNLIFLLFIVGINQTKAQVAIQVENCTTIHALFTDSKSSDKAIDFTYVLEKQTTPNTWSAIEKLYGSTNTTSFENVENGIYRIHYIAKNEKVELELATADMRRSVRSKSIVIDNCGEVDLSSNEIRTKKEIAPISIFPNPATDELFISLDQTVEIENLNMTIYNLTGSIMKSDLLPSSFEKINISDLDTGIYILSLRDGNELVHQQKLVIQ